MAVTLYGQWASDDGSYGFGEITIASIGDWNKKQNKWLEKLEDTGEVYSYDLIQIDGKVKPDSLDN